jgi:hypothetical protein
MRLALVLAIVACHPPVAQAPAPCPTPTPAPTVAAKPTLDGYWTGVLGGALRIALRVTNGEGVLDSLDQNASFKTEKLALAGDKVHFEITSVGGSYDGVLAGDIIKGNWTQAGTTQPLDLARGAAPPAPAPAKQRAPLDAPIDVTIPIAPSPLRATGATHLAYELRIVSFAAVTLDRVEVSSGTRSLATFDRSALGEMTADHSADLPGGRATYVFVWVKVDGALPQRLEHEITVVSGGATFTVPGPSVAVGAAPRVLSPPLRGARWVAGNGPSNTSAHRRALIPVGGRARISQRFAIDWVKVGDDNETSSGDPSNNASYHAYGQPALAVGNGTVVAIKDGIAENVPQQMPKDTTLDTIAGNHVILDLGGGAFAMYAHFQPGSLKVKVGDRVKPGQVLGLVGNSGNSSEPHLHFQVMDAASPLGAEGIPHAYLAFTVDNKPRTNELPAQNDVVTFP